jgi:two-component system response regulator DesR
MVNVLLGHTWRLFCEALAAALAPEKDINVIALTTTADETLSQARRIQPDIAVVDATLPGTQDFQTFCQQVFTVAPHCGLLVILDRRANPAAGLALVRLTPRVGLLGTDGTPADLAEAVRQMARGDIVLDASVAVAALTAEDNPLTDREREVLRLAVAGTPTKEIAKSLHLSAGTVRNCLSRVLAKTGARTRIEAVRVAREAGWI